MKAAAVSGARIMVRIMARIQRSVTVSECSGGVCALRYRVGGGDCFGVLGGIVRFCLRMEMRGRVCRWRCANCV